jgi:transglutaminase-like putative cysteine protease
MRSSCPAGPWWRLHRHSEVMRHTVSASLEATVGARARIVAQVAVAEPEARGADETIEITLDGRPLEWTELAAPHGGRIWLFDAPTGDLRLSYHATLARPAPVSPVEPDDEMLYLRPSRYCESDRLRGFALRQFRGIDRPHDRLVAVSSWVGTQLQYMAQSSAPTDGAVDTLLAGRGVCRDYAHLVVGLLRAIEIPARVVAVYAPGLEPMDFHAVAEALVDDAWLVVDSTLLAPRGSMVRIATGRDAADTSFLSDYHGSVVLDSMSVTAVTGEQLPTEDVDAQVQLE